MHALAVELLAFHEQGFAVEFGYSSVRSYAARVHELSGRTVTDLLKLARRLRTLPKLDAALRSGELVWTKGRTIAGVLTRDNEAAWVAVARQHAVHDLETMVASVVPGDAPPPLDACKGPARARLVLEGPAVEIELIRDLLARERAKVPECEQSDGELLVQMLRNSGGDDEEPARGERYRIVLERCPACGKTDGRRAEVEEAVAEEACCDAEVVDMESEPRGRLSRTIPPRVRRLVFHAYRDRCVVPGCSSRLWLDLHHVVPFALGGSHEPANLMPMCTAHHRLLHRGELGVERVGEEWEFRARGCAARSQAIPEVLRAAGEKGGDDSG